jgi:hypothetical protein
VSTEKPVRELLTKQEVVQVTERTYATVTALCVAYGGISRADLWRMAFARALPGLQAEAPKAS